MILAVSQQFAGLAIIGTYSSCEYSLLAHRTLSGR